MDIFKQPRGALSVLFIGLSILLAYLLIPFRFSFPGLGFAALFIAISSLAFLAKKKRTGFDLIIFAGVVILSLFLVLRANPFINFLTILTILFLGSFFLSLPQGTRGLLTLLASPFLALARIVQAKNLFPYKGFSFTPDFFKKLKIGQHLPALLITGVILLVVLPLLSYANPFFQKIVTDTIKALDLTSFFKSFTDNFFVYLLRLLVALVLLFLLPRGVSQQRELSVQKSSSSKSSLRINLLIPKIVLSFVLIVFFITQLQLYFSSAETLKAIGYTNSQFAREVFAQLSIVAFIIFLLMYADRSRSRLSKLLTTLLVIEGAFLCAIALKSVMDYTGQYGFTSKRLYGYAGVTWIAGIFTLFAYHYYKNEFAERFVKHIVVLSALVVIGINALNFDYLIYHHAKPQVFGTDHRYLSGLSPDSDSYDKQLVILTELAKAEKDSNKKSEYINNLYNIVPAVNYLQEKYRKVPLGSFNLSEYQTYQKVKNVDTRKLFEFMNDYQQAQNAIPIEVKSEATGSITSSPSVDVSQ